MDQPVLRFDVGQATNIGKKRELNEDSKLVYVPNEPRQLNSRGALFLVADGMGKYGGGAVAADSVISKVKDGYYYSDLSVETPTAVQQAVEKANLEIYQHAQRNRDFEGMGTTVVGAVIYPTGELHVFNVGDSRAYLVRDGKAIQLSTDHSVVAELARKEDIEWEDAASQLPGKKSQLTRSLGRRPKVEVELRAVDTLKPSDVIVLCSDGMWHEVDDDKIPEVAGSKKSAQAIADELVEKANELDGTDNITAVVVKCEPANVAPALVAKMPAVSTRPGVRVAIPWPWIVGGLGVVALLTLIFVFVFSNLSATPSPVPALPVKVSFKVATPKPTENLSNPPQIISTEQPKPLLPAPIILGPLAGAEFKQDQDVTLEWQAPNGQSNLRDNQAYQVWIVFQDQSGQQQVANPQPVKDTKLVLPHEQFFENGQPKAKDGKYEWSVSIVETTGADPSEVSSRTSPFPFLWLAASPTPLAPRLTGRPPMGTPITVSPTSTSVAPTPDCGKERYWNPIMNRCQGRDTGGGTPSAVEPSPVP